MLFVVAQFLTGTGIPDRIVVFFIFWRMTLSLDIVNLPQEVLSTPGGAMLMPMIESFQNSMQQRFSVPGGGSLIGGSTQGTAPSLSAAPIAPSPVPAVPAAAAAPPTAPTSLAIPVVKEGTPCLMDTMKAHQKPFLLDDLNVSLCVVVPL